VPTTYAGSEMMPIYGITEAGVKKTGRDLRVLPRTVLYDPELSRGLPLAISVTCFRMPGKVHGRASRGGCTA
jgi:maleylacetate reductase